MITSLLASIFVAPYIGQKPTTKPPPIVLPPVNQGSKTGVSSTKVPTAGAGLVNLSDIYPDVVLIAGTLPGPRPQVLLRWIVTGGWPGVGQKCNIYRTYGGVKAGPINSQPLIFGEPTPARTSYLKTHASAFAGVGLTLNPGISSMKFPTATELFQKTLTKVPGMTDRQIYSLKPSSIPVISNLDAFKQFKSSVESQVQQPGQLNSPGAIIQKAEQLPAVHSFLLQARPSAGTLAPRVLTNSSATMAAEVAQARSQVALGTLALSGRAQDYSTEFLDTGTLAVPTVYTLTFDYGGKQVDMATVSITPGSDPQPTPPATAMGVQVGTGNQQGQQAVLLVWSPPSADEFKRYIAPTYNVYRVDSGHPSGILLTPSPVSKIMLTATGGQQVQPFFDFADKTAPVGTCTYKVKTVDGLGRESSASADTQVTVADWSVPPPPVSVDAGNNDDYMSLKTKTHGVVVKLGTDKNAHYHVYRQTIDDPSSSPTLIGDIPDSYRSLGVGNLLDPNTLPDHKYRYFAASYYGTSQFHSSLIGSQVSFSPTLSAPAAPDGLSFTQSILPPAQPWVTRSLGAVRMTIAPLLLGTGSLMKPPTTTGIVRSTIGKETVTGASKVVSAKATEYGVIVHLTWTESSTLGAPFHYRIYRGNIGDAAPQVTSNLLGPSGFTAIGLAPGGKALPATAKLVGEVDGGASGAYDDGIVPSNEQKAFEYFVAATDRWGRQSGVSKLLAASIYPSRPPSDPIFLKAEPYSGNQSQVLLSFVAEPIMQGGPMVHIYRLDLGLAPPPSSGSVQRAAATILKPGLKQVASSVYAPTAQTLSSAVKAMLLQLEQPTGYQEVTTGFKSVPMKAGDPISVIDTTTTPGHEYSYVIRWTNIAGISSNYSPYLDVTTLVVSADAPQISAPTMDANGLTFSFNYTSGYVILMRAQPGTPMGSPGWVQVATPTVGKIVDRSAVKGQSYIYSAVYIDSSGNRSVSSPATSPILYNY